ncbi:SAUR-like auxin-responsive protein family [Perilla frutescens var. frutescens]|nr:SAUR-like auxin-responsive protein family [Perilla frutescens var. frutescens]
MAIRQIMRRSLSSERRSTSSGAELPKGRLAIYVGDNENKRFIIPVTYLNHPSFQELLFQCEEELGFHHPMGGLTIPCNEDLFMDVISSLSRT